MTTRVFRLARILPLALALSAATRSASAQQAPAAPEPFSFAVISDPHLAEKASAETAAYGTHVERFLRCFAEIGKLTGVEKPDFALVCGDVHPEELEKCLGQVPLPLHVVAGNHETKERRAQMRALFPADFQVDGKPADYYAFTHKGVRFIAVCDVGGGDHIGHLCSEYITPSGQCEWLEKQLAAPEPAKIVFAHIPPDPACGDRSMYLGRNDARYLRDLVARTAPTALFFGHLHQPTQEVDFGGSRCITLRSCAWNFANAPLGFLLVTVNGKAITTREILTTAPAAPQPAAR
jgi:3',5'-cyclic AMP phosphodiesterase CpdA